MMGPMLALLLGGAAPAPAEVVATADTSFTVRHQRTVNAPPAKLWATLVRPALWWNPEHTYSGDASRLMLDARPGGCWCETLTGGGVEHMRVVYLARGSMLRMVGGLGPLQALPVQGVMTIELKPEEAGTSLVASYSVSGPGLAALAKPVDGVLGEQFDRLKAAAER